MQLLFQENKNVLDKSCLQHPTNLQGEHAGHPQTFGAASGCPREYKWFAPLMGNTHFSPKVVSLFKMVRTVVGDQERIHTNPSPFISGEQLCDT